jgi:hypothetical protein
MRLMPTFVYVDAVVVDTPVVDVAFRAKLGDCRDIEERLARAQVFGEYLDSQWSGLARENLPFSWPEARSTLQGDIERAARSAARWRSPDVAPA